MAPSSAAAAGSGSSGTPPSAAAAADPEALLRHVWMVQNELIAHRDAESRDAEWRGVLRYAKQASPEAGAGGAPGGDDSSAALYGRESHSRLWPFAAPGEETTAARKAGLCGEIIRRMRRLAAGPHGFAALRPGGGAALPELQQLLSHVLQPLLDEITNMDSDARLELWRDEEWNNALLALCSPHLATVLVTGGPPSS